MNAAASILERAGGLPSARDEHWQYAALRPLRSVPDWGAAPAPSAAAVAALAITPTAGFDQLWFVDGHLAGGSLADAVTRADAATPSADRDFRLAALPALARLPANVLAVAGQRRIEVCCFCTGAAGMVYPRLELRLAADADVTLVERHAGRLATGAVLCSDFRLQLGAGAKLAHHRLHGLQAGALVVDQVQAQLAANASYATHQVSASAGQSRTSTLIELTGRGARSSWNAVMNLRAGESGDLLLRVLHQAPATESVSRFRGIASAQARASCDADVRVTASAPGARAQQSLRGLSDGAGASVNLRPRLTIDTDDVQASHGATTGQLDEQLLFYLRSRGLDLATAARLLKWAFLGDALTGIGDAAIRRDAEALLGGGLVP